MNMKLFQQTYKMMFTYWHSPILFTPILLNDEGKQEYYTLKNLHKVVKDEYFRLLEFIREYCVGNEVIYNNNLYVIKEINSYNGCLVCILINKLDWSTTTYDLVKLYK